MLRGITLKANPTNEQKLVLSQWMGCASNWYKTYQSFFKRNLRKAEKKKKRGYRIYPCYKGALSFRKVFGWCYTSSEAKATDARGKETSKKKRQAVSACLGSSSL